ncbi:hypothetical protein G7Y79_00014g036530 [Physcia stellaris]|nr:hypothetical protein G7Y79_00014g036530 [Physcia stellaris]
MVLEEITSDPDPYDSPSPSSSQNPAIDLSLLPHPIPYASLWGFSSSKLQELINNERTNAQTLLNRPLTPPEADALSYHLAKGYRYASFGTPLGAAAGLWRAVATKEEFRWPGIPRRMDGWSRWKFEIENETGTQKLNFGAREVAKGSWLRPTLMGLKGLVYVQFGVLLGRFLFASYATTVTAVGSLSDRRLKELQTEINKRSNERMRAELGSSAPAPRVGMDRDGGRADPMGQGEKDVGELWGNHRRAIGAGKTRSDDAASPTAGNGDIFGDEGGGNGSVMTDSQMQAQQRRQQPSMRRSPTENRASTFQMEKTERQPQSFSDDFDMSGASPDDGQSPTSTSTTSSGESAWDRVRRENASPNASGSRPRSFQQRVTTQQEQQEGATAGDSFTFSSSDSERSYAKDEAQKHFDERVEQERRGEDFGSGRSRRW